MLTVKLKPATGESLISFFLRFAQSNGTELLSVWNKVKHNRAANPQRMDLLLLEFSPIHTLDITKACNLLQLTSDQFFKMTFYNVLKIFGHSVDLSQSRLLKGMLRADFHFCPECLTDKKYLRQLWRVELITCCNKHRQKLLTACQSCKEQIKIRDIINHCTCPYCEADLTKMKANESVSEPDYSHNVWLYESWDTLLSETSIQITPSDCALRILYILNRFKSTFSREMIKSVPLISNTQIEFILQIARSSLSSKRTLHVQFILDTLESSGVTVADFLKLKVPDDFRNSILKVNNSKEEVVVCLSPWCRSFKKPGSLIGTGTGSKQMKRLGVKLSHHVACLDCGCEFAINEKGELQDKDYFIKGYAILYESPALLNNLAEFSRKSGLHLSCSRRIRAYFTSRGLFCGPSNGKVEVEDHLVLSWIEAINRNVTVYEIEQWNCWRDVNHLLIHRYDQRVLRAIILHKRRARARLEKEEIQKNIMDECNDLLAKGCKITVERISSCIGVTSNTLRKWGFDEYIKEMKASQDKILNDIRKNEIMEMVETFFSRETEGKVRSMDVYNYLGVRQSYLCKFAPEIKDYISNKLSKIGRAHV